MGSSDLMGLSKLWAGFLWRNPWPIEEECTLLGVKQHIYQMLPTVGVWSFSRLRISFNHLHFKLTTQGDKGKARVWVHSSQY